jgi:hypothetical protein
MSALREKWGRGWGVIKVFPKFALILFKPAHQVLGPTIIGITTLGIMSCSVAAPNFEFPNLKCD